MGSELMVLGSEIKVLVSQIKVLGSELTQFQLKIQIVKKFLSESRIC